ncbi:ER-golgi trafficking TRAPP I complex 85 kDa subunit-domain-containing protein [Tribonema minus]|uniref:ER-golgi trafficking TRAPP I complex 85 kDa subunit-domain-containing protein n=1 Tax=Tribonema minus TaxID=303371 RepID=A0A835YYI3_9STRA|nr:ER-golgi trafficking TRAPP I complex 85 kDa subunit-domain-containing protein [Tribonema minus]
MLHSWLRHRYVPTVATLVTEDADSSCLENSLTLEQLLGAFARAPDNTVPFRSAQRNYTLPTYGLRFVRGRTMGQVPTDMAVFDDQLATAAAWHPSDGDALAQLPLLTDPKQVSEALAGASLESQAWYRRYREELEEGLSGREHTLLECPAVLMMVVSSTEASGDVMACFEELMSSRHLPPPYQRAQYDPAGALPLYVLLHDVCKVLSAGLLRTHTHQAAAAKVDHNVLLQRMRSAFPPGQCRLLVVNDLPAESANTAQPDLWAEVCSRGAGGPAPQGVKGRRLSPDSLSELHKFVQAVAIQDVLPHMERRMATLNTTVTSQLRPAAAATSHRSALSVSRTRCSLRKGVKNVLKSWWRKPGGDTGGQGPNSAGMQSPEGGAGGVWRGAGATVQYPHDRIQSQIRLLADTAFIMQDYETAYGMYRMARDDFKADRALLHYAAACEGAALAAALLDTAEGARRRDPDALFAAAADAYERKACEAPSAFPLGGSGGSTPGPSAPATPSAAAAAAGAAAAGSGALSWDPLAARLATRVALLQLDIQQLATAAALAAGTPPPPAAGDEAAAEAAARAGARENALAAAVLLEAAAWQYLRRRAARRFAFHCVMAANVYAAGSTAANRRDLLPHAARCYGTALGLYQGVGGGWGAMKAHVHSMLASLGRNSAAIQLLAMLLSAPRPDAVDGANADDGGSNSKQQYLSSAQRQQHSGLLEALGQLCREDRAAARAAARAWARHGGQGPVDVTLTAEGNRGVQVQDTGVDLIGLMDAESRHAHPHGVDERICFIELALPFAPPSLIQMLPEGTAAGGEGDAPPLDPVPGGGRDWVGALKSALAAELAAEAAFARGEGGWLDVSVRGREGEGGGGGGGGGGGRAKGRRAGKVPRPVWRATGEVILVRVVLCNPLAVPLSLEELQLLVDCRLTEAPEALPLPDSPAAIATIASSTKPGTCMAVSTEQLEHHLDSFAGGMGGWAQPPEAGGGGGGAQHVLVEGRALLLQPMERRAVVLRACPLAKGLISFTGLRWRLPQAGGVWAEHALQRRGPLLQDTQEHRAMRARAPDTSLQAAVVGAMPRLECTVEGVPPTLLQGEVARARLTVTNSGGAPAGGICLKTTLPWVALEPLAAPQSPNSPQQPPPPPPTAPLGCAIGASGTALRLPLPGPLLQPGETRAVTLWVRGRGGGRQALGLLLRYKRGGDGGGGGGGSSGGGATLAAFERFVPVALDLCVLPSLSVAASVLPAYAAPREYVLSLEVTNYRAGGAALPVAAAAAAPVGVCAPFSDDRDMLVRSVCAVSRYWRMEPLGVRRGGGSGNGSKAGGESDSEAAMCHWQERLSLHYRLYPAPEPPPVTADEPPGGMDGAAAAAAAAAAPPLAAAPRPVHSDCVLYDDGEGAGGTSAASPCLPLLCLEAAAAALAQAEARRAQRLAAEEAAQNGEGAPATIQAIRRRNDARRALDGLRRAEAERAERWGRERHPHPASPSALCPAGASTLNLVVQWAAPGGRAGQHHVRGLVIRPQGVERQCPLVLTLEYAREARGGAGGGLPEVPVTLCVTNRLNAPDAAVTFTYEARPDDGPRRASAAPAAAAAPAKPALLHRFVWDGPTRGGVAALAPGATHCVALRARFLQAGVFDLNRFRFVVEFVTGRVTFVFPSQYLIRVARGEGGGDGAAAEGGSGDAAAAAVLRHPQQLPAGGGGGSGGGGGGADAGGSLGMQPSLLPPPPPLHQPALHASSSSGSAEPPFADALQHSDSSGTPPPPLWQQQHLPHVQQAHTLLPSPAAGDQRSQNGSSSSSGGSARAHALPDAADLFGAADGGEWHMPPAAQDLSAAAAAEAAGADVTAPTTATAPPPFPPSESHISGSDALPPPPPHHRAVDSCLQQDVDLSMSDHWGVRPAAAHSPEPLSSAADAVGGGAASGSGSAPLGVDLFAAAAHVPPPAFAKPDDGADWLADFASPAPSADAAAAAAAHPGAAAAAAAAAAADVFATAPLPAASSPLPLQKTPFHSAPAAVADGPLDLFGGFGSDGDSAAAFAANSWPPAPGALAAAELTGDGSDDAAADLFGDARGAPAWPPPAAADAARDSGAAAGSASPS